MLKEQELGQELVISSFPRCCLIWGYEPCHLHLGSKWGIDHPDFGRRTGTFGEKKDLPREDRAPSDGQRFEQILQALSLCRS